MFDSNAEAMDIGEYFFVEAMSVGETLAKHGVQEGDLLLCRHQEKDERKPIVTYRTVVWKSPIPSDPLILVTSEATPWDWLVYSGRIDGKGFIQKRYKELAFKFLGGQWLNRQQLREKMCTVRK